MVAVSFRLHMMNARICHVASSGKKRSLDRLLEAGILLPRKIELIEPKEIPAGALSSNKIHLIITCLRYIHKEIWIKKY